MIAIPPDLVIKNARVVDGTGAPARTADVAVSGGRITAVGRDAGAGRRTIDAGGALLTPGFVDIHTHYDGQATWDPVLAPSSWHGVTSVVMGNCGVGFAPAARDRHEWLIGLMEGVEDIPGSALTEGISWEWETFPQFLDALDDRAYAVDIAAQVPHGAVRAYVMGERGARNEPATPDDIAAMKAIVKEGVAAGALGFSTSRTLTHKAIDGEYVPGTFAAEDELFGIGEALKELGRGVYELAPAGAAGEDVNAPAREVAWMRRLSAAIDRPVSFALLQIDAVPDLWREILELSSAPDARLFPQVASRPFGMLICLDSLHAFGDHPTYVEMALLPLAERVARMRDPQVKARILAERPAQEDILAASVRAFPDRLYPLAAENPDYEPDPRTSVAAVAAAAGRDPMELLYDLLLEDEGRNVLLMPLLNYAAGNLDAQREMLTHPRAVLGLGDGGAHCGFICDASLPTTMLAHWARDRHRGPKLPLEHVVRMMTRDTAALYGLADRGTIAPGMRADLNLIDFDRVALRRPETARDLPAGGRRLLQRADGYLATFVAGVQTFADGEHTGALPGRLVRGGQ
ncbi:N-acyl-D-amino-acid deacylase family protein [Actinomadura parmotrematis]|uniref:Amidohydrolase family protein n=1 Tax=Actinomadura parmotrematis TaxID=2864039 RepID=A0ABS7FUL2_9ACTN|nr:amidohydrolase family protein [Actinomadura parmotrematis]MBW8483986.1 amidohydrolase family protein [Actinomadura parmotrematis]